MPSQSAVRIVIPSSKPVSVPSSRGIPRREYCQRPVFDARDLRGISGDVSENPAARIESGTLVYGGLLFGRIPVSRFDGSVFSGTSKPVAGSDEVNRDTVTTPRFEKDVVTLDLHLKQKECIRKIIWLISKDSKSRSCISINSIHIPRSRVGR